MKIDYDIAKDAANIAKHGLSLACFEEMEILSFAEDARRAYGETRFTVVGTIKGRLHVAIVTLRGEVTRVISLRKANKRERNRHG